MKKATKVLICVSAAVLVVLILLYALFAMWWNGAFDRKDIRDIEKYKSPDGSYSLVFQQVGDPHWSFGPTDVRLVLLDSEQNAIDSIGAQIMNDGATAGPDNIKSVEWTSDSVIIILQAPEMEDKEVIIAFR